ncbi:MAG: bacteriohemerythrin [Desulfobacterales bacterium]|uniref:Bacteriohemerythrin n=1 Tax=Candidatus Desulfaltia bathyphila TaxID=2841697 RepID=A0A8J6N5V9_9BACT|nr:bacteriohemerythrin [Candidatus Desulfaltia bathyphila]MBL7208396.1 bacteriohemerythrin [Desulfobacterales bacterium]
MQNKSKFNPIISNITDFINSYLSQMEPVILAHNGIIDKYVGDSIMALFPSSSDEAVRCAIAIHAKLNEYNTGREKVHYPPIRIGIGLNTGLLMLGTIGGDKRMESTVIGDAVNLASRIEGMSKKYEAGLLISEYTFYDLKRPDKIAMRFLDRVKVKGKTQPQSVYEVFDIDPPEIVEGKKATLKIFEEALAHYHFKHVDTSKKMIEECLRINPLDSSAQFYLDRCNAFLQTGVHESTGELLLSIEWTPEFEFGVAKIDEQHRELFEQCNKLMESILKGKGLDEVNKIISFLDEYIITHFRDEEKLMKEYEYPFLHFQKWQHSKFSRHFEKFKKEISMIDDSNRFFLLFRIRLLIVDWLVNHTLKFDKHLGRFIKRKRLGLA